MILAQAEGHTIRIHFFYDSALGRTPDPGCHVSVDQTSGVYRLSRCGRYYHVLVLAVLAIIFSFVSNISLSNVLGRLIHPRTRRKGVRIRLEPLPRLRKN